MANFQLSLQHRALGKWGDEIILVSGTEIKDIIKDLKEIDSVPRDHKEIVIDTLEEVSGFTNPLYEIKMNDNLRYLLKVG